MRQGLFPISIVCAVTAASSRKNFDKPSIATEKSFCNSKGVRILCFAEKKVFAVNTAVEAGQTAASRIGEVVSALVIPRPHASVSECMPELR